MFSKHSAAAWPPYEPWRHCTKISKYQTTSTHTQTEPSHPLKRICPHMTQPLEWMPVHTKLRSFICLSQVVLYRLFPPCHLHSHTHTHTHLSTVTSFTSTWCWHLPRFFPSTLGHAKETIHLLLGNTPQNTSLQNIFLLLVLAIRLAAKTTCLPALCG